MANTTIRLRAKKPAWDDYDVASASSHTIATITNVGATSLKVFEASAIPFKTFSPTMAYIKKMTEGALSVESISLSKYDNLPANYKIDTTANPSYAGQAGYNFIYFDYGGSPYALAFVVDVCE